ncbi:MAG: exosortase-associated EpsI family protein [Verrucomicrobiota bacterium]|jgi:hypothetical protein
MKRSSHAWFVAALVVVGVGAFGLERLRTSVRLGKPGVKVTNLPVLDEESRVARTNSVALPVRVDGYATSVEAIPRLELDYLPPDTSYGRRIYEPRSGKPRIQASVVLMGTDRTSIHRPEYCLTGQGWNIRTKRAMTVEVRQPRPYPLPVQRYDMRFTGMSAGRPAERSGIYVFWFVADGQLTNSHLERQWWLIRDLLLGQVLQRWAYVAYFADCNPGEEEATYEAIVSLIQASIGDFQLTAGSAP